MSWPIIARKDFADAGRSRLLWALSLFMVVLVAGIAAIPQLLHIPGEGVPPTFDDAISFLFTIVTLMVSIIALVVGYRAVVGERESGSIRFLIGLPHTRRDVIIGKVIGRAGVVAVPTLIGFLVGGVVVLALYDGFDVMTYTSLLALSVLIGVVYVSFAVGISAAVSSRAKAVAGVLGVYVVFDWMWWTAPMAIYWIIHRELPAMTDVPAWFVLVERLGVWEPLHVIAATMTDIAGVETIPVEQRIAGDVPFYLETWFAWVFVAGWILVPLGIGYYRFRSAPIS